jgi:hypothetical protein
MGLDTTHGAWNGSYSSFHAWRQEIARVAGLPPLDLMDGFYQDKGAVSPFCLLDYQFPIGDELEVHRMTKIRAQFPIKWECLKPNPLFILLSHSDCDGYINWGDCKKIADQLTKLLEKLSNKEVGGHIGNYKEKTETFIKGLLLAYENKEKLLFD